VQGGLVRDDIYLIGERVTRLLNRIKKWTRLASTPAAKRKLGILLYGFPPGVGAIGTAALLNVPESLEQCLQALRDEVCRACCIMAPILRSLLL
jgi:magnesium chelatase subunit H